MGDERPDSRWIAPLQEAGLLDQPLGETNDSHPISTSLASRVVSDGLGLNPATFELGRWIARCLDSSDVLNWALSQGGVLHHQLRSQIQWQLKNDAAEIPPALVKFWRVLSDNAYAHDLSSKRQRSWDYPRLEPGSVSSRRTFLGRLRPIPVFSHRIHFPDEDHVAEPDNPTDWYRVEIELVGIEGDHDIRRFRERATDWSGALVVMAHDITTHLAGALEWLEEFGRASPSDDWTHLEYRSVSPHDQNEHAPTWTNLIALARDSYDALVESGDETAALRLARRWQSLPYPVFRRLTLYAATGGQDA